MQKISPFLWFEHQAEEAVALYTSVFKDARTLSVERYPEGSHGEAGTVMTIEFELFGQTFTALNGGPYEPFTSAVSFVVRCADQAEVDRYWDMLSAGGKVEQCGWLRDRYGVTWQIVPEALFELFSDPDPEKVRRVNEAMLKMVKLDIAALRRARDGEAG